MYVVLAPPAIGLVIFEVLSRRRQQHQAKLVLKADSKASIGVDSPIGSKPISSEEGLVTRTSKRVNDLIEKRRNSFENRSNTTKKEDPLSTVQILQQLDDMENQIEFLKKTLESRSVAENHQPIEEVIIVNDKIPSTADSVWSTVVNQLNSISSSTINAFYTLIAQVKDQSKLDSTIEDSKNVPVLDKKQPNDNSFETKQDSPITDSKNIPIHSVWSTVVSEFNSVSSIVVETFFTMIAQLKDQNVKPELDSPIPIDESKNVPVPDKKVD